MMTTVKAFKGSAEDEQRIQTSKRHGVKFVAGRDMSGFLYSAKYELVWENGHREASVVHTKCHADMVKLLAGWKEENLDSSPPVELRAPGLDEAIAFFIVEGRYVQPVCETYSLGGSF